MVGKKNIKNSRVELGNNLWLQTIEPAGSQHMEGDTFHAVFLVVGQFHGLEYIFIHFIQLIQYIISPFKHYQSEMVINLLEVEMVSSFWARVNCYSMF